METLTSATPLIDLLRTKSKQALLYLEGLREACCLHRVFLLCLRSRKLLIRTGQCFILNGFIFLGSMFVLKSVVIPTLLWILPDKCSQLGSQDLCSGGGILKIYSFLHLGLVQLYLFWFYPLYIFSFILSNIWYNYLAKYGSAAMETSEHAAVEPSKQNGISQITEHKERPAGLGGFMIGISEQVYLLLLLGFFFVEVYATRFLPFVGKAFNFLLLSWMYAYYCFERADEVIFAKRRTWKGAGLGRLPIFYVADTFSNEGLVFLPFGISKNR